MSKFLVFTFFAAGFFSSNANACTRCTINAITAQQSGSAFALTGDQQASVTKQLERVLEGYNATDNNTATITMLLTGVQSYTRPSDGATITCPTGKMIPQLQFVSKDKFGSNLPYSLPVPEQYLVCLSTAGNDADWGALVFHSVPRCGKLASQAKAVLNPTANQ